MHSRFKHAIPSVDGGVIRTTLLLPFLPSPYCVKGPWKPNRTVIALYINTHCISTRTVYRHLLPLYSIVYIAIPYKVRVDMQWPVLVVTCCVSRELTINAIGALMVQYGYHHNAPMAPLLLPMAPLWRPYGAYMAP